jgi:cyanate permease
VGAPFVAWIISVSSWRWSFVVTGAFGLVWVVIWRSLVSTPEKTSWLPEAERQRILAERGGGLKMPDHDGVGYLGLIRTPAMWGLFISQGCLVYTVYLYLSWLPNYLQTARHLSVMGSGVYTAIPFLIASGASIAANWIFDKAMSIDSVHSGKRRYLVAICLAMTASGILIPFVESLPLIIVLVTVAVSFSNIGPAANGALTNDLLRSPADAGRALAFLVLGGNTFGLCAPIITGYLVEATGSFDSGFIVAGVLALIGATAALVLSHGTIGELPARRLTQPGLAG